MRLHTWVRAFAHLSPSACTPESVRLHNWVCALAHLSPCACTPESVRLHTWPCALAHLSPCACTPESMRLHTWVRALAHLSPCTCTTESVRLHTWVRALAHLSMCACTPEPVCLHNWVRALAHLSLCACTPEPVRLHTWTCALAHLSLCACTPESVRLHTWVCALAPVPESGRIDEPQGTPMATSSRKRELVIVGYSILRGVDSIVCARDKGSRTVCCLPGAQVGDILDRVDKLLARAGRDPVVMVHVGTNDIGKGRFEVLQEKFVDLAEKIRSRTSKVVFSRILPVPRASRGKQSFIWRFNTWQRNFFMGRGVQVYGALGLLLGQGWAIQAWRAAPEPEGYPCAGPAYA